MKKFLFVFFPLFFYTQEPIRYEYIDIGYNSYKKNVDNVCSYSAVDSAPGEEVFLYDIKKGYVSQYSNYQKYELKGFYAGVPVCINVEVEKNKADNKKVYYILKEGVNTEKVYRSAEAEEKDVEYFYNDFQQKDPIKKKKIEETAKEESIKWLNNRLDSFNKELDKIKKYGVAILKAFPIEGNSTTGARFKVLNLSKKTIKYITFNFYGENAVNDKVLYKKGAYNVNIKGIGPVPELQVGEWNFDYVWNTNIVEYLTLNNIVIQYMDNSIKTIKVTGEMYIEDLYNEYNYENLIKLKEETN